MKKIKLTIFILILLSFVGCDESSWPELNVNKNIIIEDFSKSELIGKNMIKIDLNEIGYTGDLNAAWKDDNTIIFIAITIPEILTDSKEELENFQNSIDWKKVFIKIYEYKINENKITMVYETLSNGRLNYLFLKVINNKDIIFKTTNEFIILSGIDYSYKNSIPIPLNTKINDAEISPDGKYLAYIPYNENNNEDKKTIYIMDIHDKKDLFNLKIEEPKFISFPQWKDDSTGVLVYAPSDSEIINAAAYVNIDNNSYKYYEFQNNINMWSRIFLCKDMIVKADAAQVENSNVMIFEYFKNNGEHDIITSNELLNEDSLATTMSISQSKSFIAMHVTSNVDNIHFNLILYDFINKNIIKTESAYNNTPIIPPVFNYSGSKVLFLTRKTNNSEQIIWEPYIIYLNK